ncbi:WD40 domain-containing protein [Rhizoctonia solani]|uniref:WD40 domain-containing protein n=1 Tax=Rhizoctonia solani TaxID=456999 RepID=A0A8H8SYQ8_9AGAM|nr:WD40 domain-containing protein [Rhizoctonia solani]QRW23501.1 WD40 domain-containing protein [Rhizoctonia solani]
MDLPDIVQARVSTLEKQLSKCKRQLVRLYYSDECDRFEQFRDEVFIGILKDTCTLVHEAELVRAPYLAELAKAADNILDDAIAYSHGRQSDSSGLEEALYDLMPSWAHDDAQNRPLVLDKDAAKFPLAHAALESLMQLPIFQMRLGPGEINEMTTKAWDPALKRHPKSTKLARFRTNSSLTRTTKRPLATRVLDARCEVSSSRCSVPIRFLTGLDSTFLALTGMRGVKNRSPALELADVASHGVIDEARRLIFLGDDDRIKSYEWGSSTEVYENLFPVHTLDTKHYQGPMMVLPDGSVVRAGKGNAGVYNIESLPTHGEYEKGIIGRKIKSFDTRRNDPEKIEPSSGSAPTSHIKFLDYPEFEPSTWQPLVSSPSTVVCAESARKGGRYSCIVIDLETGKTAMHYLGHNAACNDGFARLYDTRYSLPVVTFHARGQNEFCEAAALAHPNNIPRTHKAEQIKVWDVRARACAYELATGNNAVRSLAWDASNNSLYAATKCSYVNPSGQNRKYRPARPLNNQQRQMEYEDEDGEPDEYSGRCWPINAWHKEDYFGYTLAPKKIEPRELKAMTLTRHPHD